MRSGLRSFTYRTILLLLLPGSSKQVRCLQQRDHTRTRHHMRPSSTHLRTAARGSSGRAGTQMLLRVSKRLQRPGPRSSPRAAPARGDGVPRTRPSGPCIRPLQAAAVPRRCPTRAGGRAVRAPRAGRRRT